MCLQYSGRTINPQPQQTKPLPRKISGGEGGLPLKTAGDPPPKWRHSGLGIIESRISVFPRPNGPRKPRVVGQPEVRAIKVAANAVFQG